MSGTIVIAVAGAGASNIKSTVAVNLAVGFAAIGARTELLDADAGWHASRALTGGSGASRVAVVTVDGLHVETRAVDPLRPSERPDALIVDCAPRLDDATLVHLASADVVVVPVDGSPLSLRALDDIAAALREPTATRGAAGRVRVVLTRSLPRTLDRWALVEGLNDRADVLLHQTTIPMGRRRAAAPGPGPARGRAAALYAPTTAAAKAYAALARELMRAAASLGGPAAGR